MRFYLLFLIIMSNNSIAQVSPPLGPPVAGVADIPLKKIKFSHIRNMIELGLSKVVADANNHINTAAATSNIKATLSYRIDSMLPIYTPTEYTDYPNSMTVQLKMQIVYMLSKNSYLGVKYPLQKFHQQIVVTASCFDWHTDLGESNFTYTVQKLAINDTSAEHKGVNITTNNSINSSINNNLHKALSVSFFIDNTILAYINNNLPKILSKGVDIGELPIKNESCNCLSFKEGTAPDYADGYAGFYFFPQRKVIVGSLYSNPKIRLMSIKRLGTSGEWIGDFEELKIEYMANFNTGHYVTRPIQENELVSFKKEYSIEFEHPNKYKRLVVIANIAVLNESAAFLSGYLEFTKEQNYGAGFQTLTIMREVWRTKNSDPHRQSINPYKTLVPAYEITFNIDYSKNK